MNRRTFTGLFATTAMTIAGFALAGCPSSSTTTTTTTDTASGTSSPMASGSAAVTGGKPTLPFPAVGKTDKIKLAFVTNNPSDYWTIARAGTIQAQKELPLVDVQYEIPPTGAAAEQKSIIDNLLNKEVKGIAISPVDPANQIGLLNDTAKKAIVFTQDSDAATSDRMCYVGTDNHAAGVQAGKAMLAALPNGGDIMLFVGKKDAQNAADRAKGIKDALAGSKVNILDIRTDDADHARAKANAKDTLVKYPNLAGMMGLWSYNGPAIVSAVKEANKIGKVKIVCFDEEADTLAGVKDGSVEGTVVQNPFEFGHQAILLMDKAARGDLSVIPPSKTVIIPTRLITKDGVDAFKADLDKKRAVGK